MKTETRVLIVDDEVEILENLNRLLSDEGYTCETLQDSTRFREVRGEFQPDVVITDLRMPRADGMTLLTVTQADDPSLPVILITGFGTISSAVEAIQEGAFDYLAKPFTQEQLFVAVERASRHRRLVTENQELRQRMGETRIAGSSPNFSRVLDRVSRVAPTDANVLITGESGTGKELIARLVHDRSRRASGPFVPVDCAALPDGLMESELFGHEKGAFTGAIAKRRGLLSEANGGTVLLDEIGELSVTMQSKILRALEERQIRPVGESRYVEIDVRVVAATNVDLRAAVESGAFREDLYYRLNVVQLELPPLRERKDDLPLLSGIFLKEAAESAGRSVPKITADAWATLERYDWPGNVRQLRNVMHRLVALDDDGHVSVADLPRELRGGHSAPVGRPPDRGLPLGYDEAKEIAMGDFMRAYLVRLLDAHGGNVSTAAKTAGVSRRTVHRWMAEYRNGRPERPDDQ
ncbi:MAG: sigma-54 dependent transcriptional regulator [Gemmatimonadota bacterium]|nr:sigma-54 dependent transcriptional regulator [Gemmatimonadota bacterium]